MVPALSPASSARTLRGRHKPAQQSHFGTQATYNSLLLTKLAHRLRGGHDPLTFGLKLSTWLIDPDAAANPPAIATGRTQISPAGGKSPYFASPEIASPAFLAVSPTLLAAEVTAASRRFSAPPRLNR